MKRFSALLLVAGLGLASSPPILACNCSMDLPDQQQGQQAEIKTFSGKNREERPEIRFGRFLDEDSYQLDDQQKVQKYQGKNVRIIGTLDAENNMIHVQTIEEAV